MGEDSMLAGTLNTYARIVFIAQHMMTRNMLDPRSDSGENGSNLKNARIDAMPTNAISR